MPSGPSRSSSLPPDQEPTEEQIDQVEREAMAEALKPFHNPKLRKAILDAKRILQVIDEVTKDVLLIGRAQRRRPRKRPSTMLSNFRQFIEDNKDEIEALKILYSRPHRAGLRYRQVKELAEAIKRPPVAAPLERLWRAYEAGRAGEGQGPGRQATGGCRGLGAPCPRSELAVGSRGHDGRRTLSAVARPAGGRPESTFTADQRKWLDAIKDHIASSLRIEQDDFDDVPFNGFGGLGRAYELFGERLGGILEELNERLAA